MLQAERSGPSVVNERQPARPFVPHPAAVPLHPRVGRHLHLHLLLLLFSVRLKTTERHTHTSGIITPADSSQICAEH